MLKIGSTGLAVRKLQRRLNADGANPRLVEDGDFGPATQAAVIAAQKRHGLLVDGFAGWQTVATLETGRRPRGALHEAAAAAAAERLGVPLATVKAVVEVESRGAGFLPDGRPVILFERHIMLRQLREHGHNADALAAAHPAIVNTVRGGYLGGAAEHSRFDRARLIDAACAIESASWGLFQIMGFHWRTLGYDSAAHFEARMRTGEGEHLAAFARFIEANPAMHKALRSGKWAAFAAAYNGPAYRENLYDVRLARAAERYRALETEALEVAA